MICDICNRLIADKPSCLLGTKELVTSRDCWLLYFRGLIADNVMTIEEIETGLMGFMGELAASDTPWALCSKCTSSLVIANFPLRHDKGLSLPARGHAMIKRKSFMDYIVLDEPGIKLAMQAAQEALSEIILFDNKWQQGTASLELKALQPELIVSHGIKALSAIVEEEVGEEVFLLVSEPAERVRDFVGRDLTELNLKSGLVNTSFGPIFFLLFQFPGQQTKGQIIYENTINPKDDELLTIYKRLANQKYWHVIVADDYGNIVNSFEFPNQFNLKETLNQIIDICKDIKISDFKAAKSEYERKYSLEMLLAM